MNLNEMVLKDELGHTWIFLGFLVQSIVPGVKFLNVNKFSGSEYKWVMALHFF